MQMNHRISSYTCNAWLYILISACLILLDCNVQAHARSDGIRGHGSSFKTSDGPYLHNRTHINLQANLGRNPGLSGGGVRSSVSHIYHKGSPHRPPNCDDECIYQLRVNRTLYYMAHHRMGSTKVAGWIGKINSGYYIRKISGEWYTTFDVGTPKQYAREQVVDLTLDTGSPFTWFQCKPCQSCFPQKIRLFDRKKSTSYRRLNENDLYCGIAQNLSGVGIGATPEVCRYLIEYADITFSRGSVAEDLFKLENLDNRGQTLELLLGFGCGFNNRNSFIGGAGGILGLSNSRIGLSIPEQLTDIFGSEFGFCLPSLNEPADAGYIIFGQGSTPSGMYPSTPFVHTDGPFFYVDLVDMSVNNVRLNVPPGTFDMDDDEDGGVITDTGAPISFLAPAAYDLLVVELRKVFDQLGAPYYPPQKRGFGPCWGAEDLDTSTFPFPRIAWHFRDGNSLEISTAGSYVLYKTNSHLMSVCAPFIRRRETAWKQLSVIGGHSQINTYMYFDLPNERMGWVYGSC